MRVFVRDIMSVKPLRNIKRFIRLAHDCLCNFCKIVIFKSLCFCICHTSHNMIENIQHTVHGGWFFSITPVRVWEVCRLGIRLPITSKHRSVSVKHIRRVLPIWSQVRKTDSLHYVILTFRWFIIAESWSGGSELFNLIMSARLFTLGSVVCLVIN